VKSSSSSLYIHIRTFLSTSTGSSSLLPSGGLSPKIGKMSGEPKVNDVDDWFSTESKLTGLCFQPVQVGGEGLGYESGDLKESGYL
jgi:hypothetical protein